ncbi:MAG: hypothetical protein IJU76_13595, partial [Desulfovibrionaceae bacterium]|nr:hypothetical protein [Desulfovibrionaceae bacterium]
ICSSNSKRVFVAKRVHLATIRRLSWQNGLWSHVDNTEGGNSRLLKVVDQTIDTFGQYRPTQLSAWTHKKGSPWYRAVNGDNANEAAGLYGFIPDDFIRDYFCERVLPYVERQER